MRVLLLAALACARAYDHDTQAVKSVKGGHGGVYYQGGDISRFYNNNTYSYQNGAYNSSYSPVGGPGQAPAVNFEVGVCYIEVPTASLVRDKVHVPAGNGSRPDLSRVRTCCKGYERNVYNFKICEPVCKQECINALCTAPDTCTCYPDHVRNLGGVCVATCPIGCQNGRCSGSQCVCNEGYKLDIGGKFCVPLCRDNCGGIGNCTAPNTCSCRDGLQPSPDGSCKMSCGKCENGDCVSSNECRCRQGYAKDSQGSCTAICRQQCGPNERCIAPNVCSLAPAPGHTSGPHQTNSQNPYGPGQNNTYYPNQGTYPHIYNQNGPQNPNQGPNSNQGSGYPYPQQGPNNQPNPYQPQQGSAGYPYPNSNHPQHGTNYPQNPNQPQSGSYNPNQQQVPNYPYPNQSQGSNYPSNPNQPGQGPNSQYSPNQPQSGSGYPHSTYHQGSNFPQYPYGQNPQNNSFNQGNSQYPNQPNQGPYQPIYQTVNVSRPQYPLPSENQLGPYHPQNPDQNQRPGTYNQGSYPQYPSGSNQPNYPSQQQGYNNQGYPYNQGAYGQYPYDQTQQSSLCSEPCINGTCIDHNRCRCNPGYIADETDPSGNKCQPHCPGGCPNGYCVAPHTCACAEGYYRDGSVKGRAACLKRIRRSLDLVFKIPDYADQ